MTHTHSWHACEHGYVVSRCRCMEGSKNIVRDRPCPDTDVHKRFVGMQEINVAHAEIVEHDSVTLAAIEQSLRTWKDNLEWHIETNGSNVSFDTSLFDGELRVVNDLLASYFDK